MLPEEIPFSRMTVDERLVVAGLLDEFDKAAFADNEKEMRELLLRVDLDSDAVAKTIDWVRNAPYSRFNKQPIILAAELKGDTRLASLDQTGVRIVQHLFDSHGGVGGKLCIWKDCGRHALKELAFCAYCAHVNAPVSK